MGKGVLRPKEENGDRKKQTQEAGGGSGSRPLMGAGARSTRHTWGEPGLRTVAVLTCAAS